MTTASANLYAPLPLPSSAMLMDTLAHLPPVSQPRIGAPRAAWFNEGWEGAGYSPIAVLVELGALALLVIAALVA